MRNYCSAFAKKWILLVIAAAILLIIGVNLFVLSRNYSPVFKMEPADAESKLFGIEPNAGGIIYDPEGKKIDKTISTEARFYFTDDSYIFRTFIFELPKSEKTFYPVALRVKRPDNGNSIYVKSGWNKPFFAESYNCKILLSCTCITLLTDLQHPPIAK